MLISAGVEKFYTFAQFLSVLILSAGVIWSTLLAAFLASRPPASPTTRRATAVATLLIFYLVTEICLAVASMHEVVRVALALNCVAVFVLSRAFFLLCRTQFGDTHDVRAHLVVFAAEAVLLAVLQVASFGEIVFFTTATFDAVVPGPLFFALVSLSAGWTLGGAWILSTSREGSTPRQRRARTLAVAATLLALVAYLASHIVPGAVGVTIFPPSLLVSVGLLRLSLVRFNLLDVLLAPLERVAVDVDMLVVVVGEDGAVVSMNRTRHGPIDMECVASAAALFDQMLAESEPSDERRALAHAANLTAEAGGRIDLTNDGRRYRVEYQTIPVIHHRRRVGWMVTILDITEEEASIRELQSHEEQLRIGYEELRMYSREALAGEAERARERLIRRIDMMTRAELSAISGHLEALQSDPRSEELVEATLSTARASLDAVREGVRILRDTGRSDTP